MRDHELTNDELDLSDLDVEGLERRLELATAPGGFAPDWSITVSGHG